LLYNIVTSKIQVILSALSKIARFTIALLRYVLSTASELIVYSLNIGPGAWSAWSRHHAVQLLTRISNDLQWKINYETNAVGIIYKTPANGCADYTLSLAEWTLKSNKTRPLDEVYLIPIPCKHGIDTLGNELYVVYTVYT